ncbi:hypothetical protein [Runella limosa]|uniref:hypothetical protein n=1 Tax=Runella limosa TaxID=370978 RepID=UPI0003FA088F|nr:hypothetical protein [Runella limosa]
MALTVGKKVRVKADVPQTIAYDFPDTINANIVKYFKAGEVVGTISKTQIDQGGDFVNYVEVILTKYVMVPDAEYDVNIVYVPFSDIDIISEDVDTNDTIVYDENGNKLPGTAYEYPDAIPTGDEMNGKRVFVVKKEAVPTSQSSFPKWLKYGLWVVVILGSVTALAVLYKTLSK